MDNIGRLADQVESIYKAAEKAQNPSTVGAVAGVLQGSSTVLINGKCYHAVFTSTVIQQSGTRVWCQLAGSSRAVVIGGT